jgi:hypothetical protein
MTSVSSSVDVDLDPEIAFDVFVGEIDAWYRVDRFTVTDFTRTVSIRFEPHAGGRFMDVYDAESGEGREMGRITAWEPGRRLVFTDNRQTEVEVTFARVGQGTRVTLEHRGLESLAPEEGEHVRRYGWRFLLTWFRDHVDHGRETTR